MFYCYCFDYELSAKIVRISEPEKLFTKKNRNFAGRYEKGSYDRDEATHDR
jgi:hypothetical protein